MRVPKTLWSIPGSDREKEEPVLQGRHQQDIPRPWDRSGGAVSSWYRQDQALWEAQGSGPQLGTPSRVSYIRTGQSRMLALKSPPPWTLLILPGTRMIPSLYLLCCCCCSVTKSCWTICDPMDYSMSGLPVPHHLPESTQVHVHWIGGVIQPLYSSKDCSFEIFNFFFFWLHQVLVAECRTQFPNQGANLDPLHWECRVLATGPPGKSPKTGS